MTPFLKANFPIWDLPMKERFEYCKTECSKFGLKLTWEQAKQYYNEMYNCEAYRNDTYEYSCRECGTYGSVHRTYKEDDSGLDCPKCKSFICNEEVCCWPLDNTIKINKCFVSC